MQSVLLVHFFQLTPPPHKYPRQVLNARGVEERDRCPLQKLREAKHRPETTAICFICRVSLFMYPRIVQASPERMQDTRHFCTPGLSVCLVARYPRAAGTPYPQAQPHICISRIFVQYEIEKSILNADPGWYVACPQCCRTCSIPYHGQGQDPRILDLWRGIR